MKNFITLLLLGTFFFSKGQDKITFSYDPLSGNQITRELCLNCQTGNPSKDVKEIEAIVESDLLKFSDEDTFSYYPNPVKEELYLTWESKNENNLTNVKVFSFTGQILKTYQIAAPSTNLNIPFQSFPSGVYIVSLWYSNGEQKTIKIIKN